MTVDARRASVQNLRASARACRVPLVPDNASRSRVQAMMASIRTSAGAASDKASAERAFAAALSHGDAIASAGYLQVEEGYGRRAQLRAGLDRGVQGSAEEEGRADQGLTGRCAHGGW